MSNLTNDLLKNKFVALRIAIPGEAVAQHDGRVLSIDESTITIVNSVKDSADLVITSYNLQYVILIQYIQPAEVEAVEKNNSEKTEK